MTSSVARPELQDVAKEEVEGAVPTLAQNAALNDTWKQRVGHALRNGWEDRTGEYRRRWREKDLSEDNGFEYMPLPLPSCIRLLTLEPGKPADVIRCSLRTVDLNDRPSYTALSYAWEKGTSRGESWSHGAAEMLKEILHLTKDNTNWPEGQAAEKNDEIANGVRKNIICNGRTMKLFPNLYDALLELRLKRAGDYWIDAVCMNQLNNDERTAQVAIMGRIYQEAESVTAWLGTCPALLTLGVESEIALAKLNMARPIDEYPDEREELLFGVIGIVYMFTRTWFRRIWTVQEVCFARQITFMMGKHEIDQDLMIYFANRREVGEVAAEYTEPGKWATHLQNIIAVLESRQFFKEGGRWSLEQWLQAVKGRKVKQARDLIYGGLSLVNPGSLRIDQNLQRSLPASLSPRRLGASLDELTPTMQQNPTNDFDEQPLWPAINANYDVETPEVFLNVTACVLSQPKGLNVLFSLLPLFSYHGTEFRHHPDFVQQDQALEQRMPSWVLNPKFWSALKLEPFSSVQYRFAACSQLPNDPQVSANGKTLYLDAVRLDEIDHVWPRISSWLLVERIITHIKDLRKNHSPLADSSDALLGLFAHVAVAGRLSKSDALVEICNFLHGVASDDISRLKNGWKALPPKQVNIVHEVPDQDCSLDGPPSKKYGAAELEAAWAELKAACPNAPWPPEDSETPDRGTTKFQKVSDMMMYGRSIFVTKGGYLGLGRRPVQLGDQVVLVKGIDVPHIFRRVDDDLRRRADEVQDLITELKREKKATKVDGRSQLLNAKLKGIESHIGNLDGWVLAGDAYVEGVMYGEKMYEGLQFERLAIV